MGGVLFLSQTHKHTITIHAFTIQNIYDSRIQIPYFKEKVNNNEKGET